MKRPLHPTRKSEQKFWLLTGDISGDAGLYEFRMAFMDKPTSLLRSPASQNITRGTRHDSPILKTLLKPLPKSSGDLCADPAYLSRRNCNLIATKGRTPIIKPKRNTTIRKHGSQPWRDMITLWLEDQTTFLKRYHQRSKAESVYSALKRCYRNHLSSRRRTAQNEYVHWHNEVKPHMSLNFEALETPSKPSTGKNHPKKRKPKKQNP